MSVTVLLTLLLLKPLMIFLKLQRKTLYVEDHDFVQSQLNCARP